MDVTQFREMLRRGDRLYGTLITSRSPRWVRVVKNLGLDFVFIDTEHVALDRERLSWMCVAYREAGVAPLVRIPSPDPYAACMALDGGAVGIVAPYVESASQVRELVGAVHYNPLKGEKLRCALAGEKPLPGELAGYLARRNQHNVFVANIESTPAIESLDEILSVDELDGVLIGPHDLSCSLGIPEQYHHERFRQAVEEIISRARQAGKGAGIHLFYDAREDEIAWARQGMNLIVHRGDIQGFEFLFRRELSELKQALGDSSGAADRSSDPI